MEQHQPNQTDHLRIDHWSGSWSCCSAGIRNLDSRNHVRRSTERNRPASGILPGYECTLPHEVWSEDQFKIYALIASNKGEVCKVLFEPNETIVEGFFVKAPRKVIRK